MTKDPLVVEFVPGTRLHQQPSAASGLPIVGNGPPGSYVQFASGSRVSLPTDQIVSSDDSSGSARVGFGGMRFDGVADDSLVFLRVKDLWPVDRLSPERGRRMTLKPEMVTAVFVDGHVAWPATH